MSRPQASYVVTTETATVYKVRTAVVDGKRQGFGWADAAVRSWPRGGSISIQSDFGTFAYTWNATGDRPFVAFLASLDFDYFMGKASPGYMIFDHDKTVATVKRRIIEHRRGGWGDLSRDQARECWYALSEVESTNSADYFLTELLRSPAVSDFFGGDYGDLVCRSPDPQSVGFWKEIWPALCAAWQADLIEAAA